MKKVLVIGYVWPEPNSSAAGGHMMSMLRAYKKQGWSVEFATPAKQTEHMSDLSLEGISQQAIVLNCDSFDNYVKNYDPNIVVFDRFMMEEQFAWRVEKNCPQAMRILDTMDLQCLRHARHQAVKQDREMTNDDLFSDVARREIAAILRSDLSFLISSFEMRLLIETFSVDESLLCHVPFMVDCGQVKKTTKPFKERQHFVSIGSFRHEPNWDSVLYLKKMWPAIRQKLPKADIHIYGSYPPPKAMQLHNPKMGFLVKGWAEDAHEVLESARVCLAPLRFGAGLKGKLLDAMLTQTPSVTTSIGSEGMFDNHVWPGAICDSEDVFVREAIELYQNETVWLSAQKNIEPLLGCNYDAEHVVKKVIDEIENVLSDLDKHRTNNFYGGMLRHHSMASMKYMSQWIAEKNKNL